jgi:hypothetical protein
MIADIMFLAKVVMVAQVQVEAVQASTESDAKG